MILLAIDTSSAQGSLALARDNELMETTALPARRHSAALHGEIVALLERQGLTSSDIQGYGVAAGPGSFTGVRVGLTAVKGLAEVNGKPVVAVSTLEILASAATTQLVARSESSVAAGATLLPVLDARRGQVFAAAYRSKGEWFQPLLKETVCSLESFLERVREAGVSEPVFCGTDFERYGPEIERAGWGGVPREPVSPYLAGSLAQIAVERLRKGLGSAAWKIDANYVRSSDAELFLKG